MPQPEPVTEPLDEQDEWLEDPDELPPRPRRRLLGTGANPIFLALLGVLAIACGFIGGVLVEKGQTSSGSATGATAGLAARFAALRGGTSGTSARSGAGAAGAAGTAGALFGAGAGPGRPTAGTVAYLAGDTLYVTNAEGNTVKVKTSAGTNVTKNVKASVDGIHPGETVTVTGAAAADGTVNAESISVGSNGGALSALFGGSGARSSSGKSSGGGEQALFGGG
jgi:DNA-binding beta-propeller fold protein YncE